MIEEKITREAVEHALRQRVGMDDDRAEKLAEFNATQSDWFGHCRKCKCRLTGTPEQLKGHKCGS